MSEALTGTPPARVVTALSEPHHDGSEVCVTDVPDELGGDAVVRLRVPHGAGVDAVALRSVPDGETRIAAAEVDEETPAETWWRATLPLWNPETRYRWLVRGESGHAWVNGQGVVRHDVADDDDFVLDVDRGGPDWHLSAVVYEIFPDRFAPSELDREPPDWAVRRAWDELPTGRGPDTAREWFGGDLAGIERRLDHVESLGASVLYLTPVFPARSVHRYDATSFERIDPLLGGDTALSSLVAAAHGRGIRVVGDLTLNHTGAEHDWFVRGREEQEPERSFYFFDPSIPGGYASWSGVLALPKLDWRSTELRARMADALRRWLVPPFELDGWRIDVANMAGRYRDVDRNREVRQVARAAVDEARPDGLLIAEHGHDFRHDLGAGGWHGVMNYAGFLRPTWWWLRGESFDHDPFLRGPARRFDGLQTVATMRAFRAGVPWRSVLHSWALLDSHDTARFRTVSGSRDRHLVGLGLQMTTPGVPMVFAGDEIGLEGDWGEDGRRPMPWSRPHDWDQALLEEYRRLIDLRRSSEALARGGIRYAHVDGDVIVYVRESRGERLLCLASRADHEPVRLPLEDLGIDEAEPVLGPEPVYDNGELVLNADGPAFHAWSLR